MVLNIEPHMFTVTAEEEQGDMVIYMNPTGSRLTGPSVEVGRVRKLFVLAAGKEAWTAFVTAITQGIAHKAAGRDTGPPILVRGADEKSVDNGIAPE